MKDIIETLKELQDKGLTLTQVIEHLENKEDERVKKVINTFVDRKDCYPIKNLEDE